mmetsp:Transcript_51917/g.162731  ORF Transcript_51917/g.162731 Transcript_51917/m.162731 type:complete len:92 (-) Transcript_51917:681-956(-)
MVFKITTSLRYVYTASLPECRRLDLLLQGIAGMDFAVACFRHDSLLLTLFRSRSKGCDLRGRITDTFTETQPLNGLESGGLGAGLGAGAGP